MCKVRDSCQLRTSLCNNKHGVIVLDDKVYMKHGPITSKNRSILKVRELHQKRSILDQSRIYELLPYKKSQTSQESLIIGHQVKTQ